MLSGHLTFVLDAAPADLSRLGEHLPHEWIEQAIDALVRMRVSPQARQRCPELPEWWTARAIRVLDAGGRERVLLTSLTDRRRFKAADLDACYKRRWQVETSYRELKQSMLGSELTLRSRTVEGVCQEIWGALIAYNLIRR
ncbi:transposase, partial [Ralstonia solanacearum]